MIDTEKLREVFSDCLFKTEEIIDGKTPENAIVVEGIAHKFGFHPERLESHRKEVVDWLKQLPDQFFKGTGDGWTFLNMPTLKNGALWGEQINAEALMCLGLGLKIVSYVLPREMWKVLPGSMPYVMVDL